MCLLMIWPNAKQMLGTFTYMVKFKKGRGQTKNEKEAEVYSKLFQLEYMTWKQTIQSDFEVTVPEFICVNYGVFIYWSYCHQRPMGRNGCRF